MEADIMIRDYIKPKAKMTVKTWLGAAFILASAAFFFTGNIFPSTGTIFDAVPLSMFILGVYIFATAAPDCIEAVRNMKRSFRMLDEKGETARAAMEFHAADGSRHYVITEHYVFSEGTGTAVSLSEIKKYNFQKSNWSRSVGTYDGIMAQTYSGKWFTVAGGNVAYAEYVNIYRLLDEAIEKNQAERGE